MPPTCVQIFTLLFLLFGLVGVPDLALASQNSPSQEDSTAVLAITRYKTAKNEAGERITTDKIQKISYIAPGAIVNVKLEDGRTIKEVPLNQVGEDHLVIGKETIPLSTIERISVGKSGQRDLFGFLGTLVFAIGVFFTVVIIALASSWDAGLLWFLLAWIPGGYWVIALFRKFPGFRLKKSNLRTKVVSMSSLPERVQKRLNGKHHFYHNRLRKY